MTGLFVWRILSGNIFEENIFGGNTPAMPCRHHRGVAFVRGRKKLIKFEKRFDNVLYF